LPSVLQQHKNTNTVWSDGDGEEFPVAVGLQSIGLLDKDLFWECMDQRADCLLEEIKRIHDIGEAKKKLFMKGIGLNCNVMYNLDMPILQASVTFVDPSVDDGRTFSKQDIVHCVMFVSIREGGEDVRRRLHPFTMPGQLSLNRSSGPGDISHAMRQRLVEELKKFICKVNEIGLPVHRITFSIGLMWMKDDDFTNGTAKELEEMNGGDRNKIWWSLTWDI
jgi:hypothetical protein